MKDMKQVPRMSEEALRAFVRDYCDGWIFTSGDVSQPKMLGSVFMPLALGALAGWPDEAIEQLGLIWEHRGKAGPMAVNGMPTFFSCNLMHREDWQRARAAIERELKRREDISIE